MIFFRYCLTGALAAPGFVAGVAGLGVVFTHNASIFGFSGFI
jgi:hypothetical protein